MKNLFPLLVSCGIALAFIPSVALGQTATVTFQVDMSQLSEPYSYGAVYLNSSFTGWCGGCDPMTDVDNDGVWTLTRQLDPGTYEYKFSVDGWNAQEWFNEGESCTSTIDGYTNRTITVAGEDLTLDVACFSECGPCMGPTQGCTYIEASNYDPMATIDDNSCAFEGGTVTSGCASDLNADGTVSTADLLEFLISFGQIC